MRRKVSTVFFSIFIISVVLVVFVSLRICRDAISVDIISFAKPKLNQPYLVVREEDLHHRGVQFFSSVDGGYSFSQENVSILLPDWEILVITMFLPENFGLPDSSTDYSCVFGNKLTSPARFSGVLPFTNQTTFKCVMPNSVRRHLPFLMPELKKSSLIENNLQVPEREMMRWNFLVYDSFSTDNDVVVFAKGVNNRQGINRSPESLRCVFGEDTNTVVKTVVKSSSQEVFRCPHPDLMAENFSGGERIKISIEISDENRTVPSVAYYRPRRRLAVQETKSQLCASTMIYNSAKFVREWVVYHSKIGVDKFILYDNDSDDDLHEVVEELVQDGYDVKTVFWLWPKTQEAGFSHSALYAKESCEWILYVDVDEFIFSPSWLNSSKPSPDLLKSFLPNTNPLHLPSSEINSSDQIGQISIQCYEFGPSNQSSNPINGVTQGYTCRRIQEQRHKSIVLLDAINLSLANAIHHFELKDGYKSKQIPLEEAIVNHYKYQAWSEFKAKFRRRVSAYVVDWTQNVNPTSKDRTPGLGFAPIEPKGWANMFCEVEDDRLQKLTQKWFGSYTSSGNQQMVWQR